MLLLLALAAAQQAAQRTVTRDAPPPRARPLPSRTTGRTVRSAAGARRQWPGTYFETAFRGRRAWFRVGPGEVSLRVSIDGGVPVALARPAPGTYRVDAGAGGTHRLRVDVASESQAGPTVFGGFLAPQDARAAVLPRRAHAIEFVGDSHTVGYGNTSSSRDCTERAVWDTTDTSRGIAPLVAARYRADYRVNAISGRGVVRNYDGFAADTLPQAYPFALFDHTAPADDAGWHPQAIVVALGTNDFSTRLRTGERWATRDALHADFEATYAAFLRRLRARYRSTYILLWATDLADGEIAREAGRVADAMTRGGDRRVGFVAVTGLAMTGCHAHPSLSDDRIIADAIAAELDRHVPALAPRRRRP